MKPEKISFHELQAQFTDYTQEQKLCLEEAYQKELAAFENQIVVLDDDPTGTQTVHDVYVYTELTEAAIREGFSDGKGLFYLLTNSRSFSEEKTAKVHRDIARSVLSVSRENKKDFLLISRGDSTLRGHYPLETDVIRETLEEEGYEKLDGLILCPFFPEGGRFTANDIHYCQDGEALVPAGETEFAKDATFGYASSDLKNYIEEKSRGKYPAAEVICISLQDLRNLSWEKITDALMEASGFRQIVVNAVTYEDLTVFAIAFMRAVGRGKHFLIRSAAALPRILGGIPERECLRRWELLGTDNPNGGLVIVGSHVEKTNRQIAELEKVPETVFLEFSTEHAEEPGALAAEKERVVRTAEQVIRSGRTAVVYTSRTLVLPKDADPEAALAISVAISGALTDVAASISVEPSFILAKGGITSSDTAVYGLGIRKALVLGQADKGIPVWRQGEEARFPGRSYIIFPGNVGTEESLKKIVERLVS